MLELEKARPTTRAVGGGGLLVRDLSTSALRANPQYELTRFDQLTHEERQLLSGLEEVNRYAGILRSSRDPTLSIQAVSPAVASLFSRLQRPGPAAGLEFDGPTSERDVVLAGLVLDGVLEVENDRGVFLSRFEAYDSLVQGDEGLFGSDRIARLSIRALRHVEAMEAYDASIVAVRLYFFNRLPATPSWQELWPDARTVARRLALDDGGALGLQLRARFSRIEREGATAPWIVWRAIEGGHAPASGNGRYKLYVSPMPECVSRAVAGVVVLLTSHRAAAMKIGADAYGLLRPDKLMVYFDTYQELDRFAHALLPAMTELRAHGVPFTAPIDRTGILSWGVDPPRDAGSVPWYEDDSFRIWICNRMAVGLVAACRHSRPGPPPWRFALARLWLSGIDTRHWTWRAGPSR